MDNIIPVPGILFDGKNRPTSMGGGRINLSWEKFRGAVWVNKNGERFVNEDGFGQDDKERALMHQPDMTFFVIFDEKARLANPSIVTGWTMEKFQEEANRGVTVKKASSIEALARSMGVDAAKLKDTIARYNASVAAGRDAEFGRDKLQFPVAQGPFYALQTIGFFLLTMGGIKVNYRLEAEDEHGQRIPGLFAAGEVLGNGQLAGDGLVGGMSVTPSYVFGRLAARYALDYVRGVLNRAQYT
jgi:fumarate reductase flavoprotein subunit